MKLCRLILLEQNSSFAANSIFEMTQEIRRLSDALGLISMHLETARKDLDGSNNYPGMTSNQRAEDALRRVDFCLGIIIQEGRD